jgi:hypothetical protein
MPLLSPRDTFNGKQGGNLPAVGRSPSRAPSIDKSTGEIFKPSAPIGLVNRCISGKVTPNLQYGTVKLLKTDVIIKRKNRGYSPPRGGIRSSIKKFSPASQHRLKLAVRNASIAFKFMLTLTYPLEYPTDGTKVKRDLIAMRHCLVRLGLCGIMVLKFQERGAPHFHLLFNDIELNKKEISSAWYRIVWSVDEKHLKAGTSIQKLRSQHGR